MIRWIIHLAVKAARDEARRLMDTFVAVPAPKTEPAPAVQQQAAVTTASKWSSPAYHVSALNSATCPDCGEPKKLGWYRCQACRKVAS